MSIALAVAIGNSWVRDHRNGVWTMQMTAIVAIAAIVLGGALGWALQQYLAFVAASATERF